MARYRKKPVVIEAEQFWPDKKPWPEGVEAPLVEPHDEEAHYAHPFVQTLEGPLMCSPGDWIITGVKGERYPCKPDIFKATYEAVD